ncbi:MAG: PxxKW family cysteine-rich protein [bacterium]
MLTCNIAKVGKACVFMKKAGCSYNGGTCHPVIESCSGCSNVEAFPQGQYCRVSPEPSLKWNSGKCNMATHLEKAQEQSPIKKVNPLKASKRAAR